MIGHGKSSASASEVFWLVLVSWRMMLNSTELCRFELINGSPPFPCWWSFHAPVRCRSRNRWIHLRCKCTSSAEFRDRTCTASQLHWSYWVDTCLQIAFLRNWTLFKVDPELAEPCMCCFFVFHAPCISWNVSGVEPWTVLCRKCLAHVLQICKSGHYLWVLMIQCVLIIHATLTKLCSKRRK